MQTRPLNMRFHHRSQASRALLGAATMCSEQAVHWTFSSVIGTTLPQHKYSFNWGLTCRYNHGRRERVCVTLRMVRWGLENTADGAQVVRCPTVSGSSQALLQCRPLTQPSPRISKVSPSGRQCALSSRFQWITALEAS